MCSDPLLDPALDHRLTDKLPPRQKGEDPLVELARIVSGRDPAWYKPSVFLQEEKIPNDGTHDIPLSSHESAELRKLRGELSRALHDRSTDLVDLWV